MRRVIVIGASSGIGEKIALYYARKGCTVGIAARREERLAEIASYFPDNIIYKAADMSAGGEGGALDGFTYLKDRLNGADLVIYCSGAGEQNTLLDIGKEINAIKVNIEGFVMIATAFFTYLLNRGGDSGFKPQFVVISSAASVRGIGVAASYSASKRFQTVYMEGLAQLAAKKGLKITFTSILPGFIRTDFIKGRNYPFTMSADYAVKRIIKAVEKRRSRKIIDWKWGIIVFLWKLIPGFVWRKIKI